MRVLVWTSAIALLVLTACGQEDKTARPSPKAPSVAVVATIETQPMQDSGDAADDPAIWVDHLNPANSVIIGTNKDRGLAIYALDGKELSFREDGKMNNVDIRQGVTLGDRTLDVVVATNRTNQTLALYRFQAASRTLEPFLTPVPTGFKDPYGVCLYRDLKGGELHVFANDKDGTTGQWRITASGAHLKAEKLREFKVGSQAEGCVGDDANSVLFVAEEDVGVYAYTLDSIASGAPQRVEIDTVAHGKLTADVEGVAIADEGNGTGYLIVSSQGSNSYNVYDRKAPYALRGVFTVRNGSPAAHETDAVEDTDGLDVTTAALGAAFPGGVFVAQDGANFDGPNRVRANQNFKLVSWAAIKDALKLAPAQETSAHPVQPAQ